MIKLSEQAQAIYDKYSCDLRYSPIHDKLGLYMNAKTSKELISKHKSELTEIKAMLKEQYEAEQMAIKQRADKRAAIPGVKELNNAREALANYRRAFQRAMERGDGWLPSKPNVDLAALTKQYPRAAALLKAEEWELADNDVKSTAGRAAADEIINGTDYEVAISTMEKKWSDYCNERIWN